MNFHQLHIFYTVSERGSFGGGADSAYDPACGDDADSGA